MLDPIDRAPSIEKWVKRKFAQVILKFATFKSRIIFYRAWQREEPDTLKKVMRLSESSSKAKLVCAKIKLWTDGSGWRKFTYSNIAKHLIVALLALFNHIFKNSKLSLSRTISQQFYLSKGDWIQICEVFRAYLEEFLILFNEIYMIARSYRVLRH